MEVRLKVLDLFLQQLDHNLVGSLYRDTQVLQGDFTQDRHSYHCLRVEPVIILWLTNQLPYQQLGNILA